MVFPAPHGRTDDAATSRGRARCVEGLHGLRLVRPEGEGRGAPRRQFPAQVECQGGSIPVPCHVLHGVAQPDERQLQVAAALGAHGRCKAALHGARLALEHALADGGHPQHVRQADGSAE
jgi:hypothetical protein